MSHSNEISRSFGLDKLVMKKKRLCIISNNRLYPREKMVMDNADIVFSTNTSIFSPSVLEVLPSFNAVIVDEAAACTLPSVLIPIVAASKKQGSHTSLIVALVGDPHQLCPVVKTRHRIAKQILEESLLQKLLEKRDDRVKSVF